MSREKARKRVHELRIISAKAHKAYIALVGAPKFMKVVPTTPKESKAIAKALERCNHVDAQLARAIQDELNAED